MKACLARKVQVRLLSLHPSCNTSLSFHACVFGASVELLLDSFQQPCSFRLTLRLNPQTPHQTTPAVKSPRATLCYCTSMNSLLGGIRNPVLSFWDSGSAYERWELGSKQGVGGLRETFSVSA